MARLGFNLVGLGLFWFGLFTCLKKKLRVNYRREKQKGKRTSGEKT